MTKKTEPQKIRAARKEIIIEIPNIGKQSIHKLASIINRSKSSAHHHLREINTLSLTVEN